jgi:hypothetical protein
VRHKEPPVDEPMSKKLKTACLTVCLITVLSPAWGKAAFNLSQAGALVRQPEWVFTVGPGTIVSVHIVSLPFIAPYYVVQFKTDEDQFIEMRHFGGEIPLFDGMHGMLDYSVHPERILGFRTIEK